MELVTAQTIYYSNRNPLPVEDVANSLLALKSILQATPDVLEMLEPGLVIKDIQVHINEISTGSLIEDLFIKFTWGTQEALLSDVEKVRNKLGVQPIMENKKLLGCIIVALILAGGLYSLIKSDAPAEQKAVIEANNNVVINIGAEMTGLSADQFRAIIDAAVSKNQHVQKDAARIVQPAKREADASITLNGVPATAVSAQAVAAMPSIVSNNDEPMETIEDFSNVEIQLRAIDLDSTKRGWAAVVPSVDDRRTKMHLDPHIRVADLLGKTSIKGDISVVFRHDAAGKKVPYLIFLRNFQK